MKKSLAAILLSFVLLLGAAGCGGAAPSSGLEDRDTRISPDLTFTQSMPLDYAQGFAVDYYQEGYALITISDGDRYLVIPQGQPNPSGLAEDIVLLHQPLQNLYLAASAAMDMFVSMDALDAIRFSALQADGWYIQPARAAMEEGKILYAGKYSAPDYERILEEGCGLAIENTMISHTPEVREQLEKLGIPVLMDYSSYESHPLGRTEWAKLYGVLLGKSREAEAAFEAEKQAFEAIGSAEPTGKTVAFFYITSGGEANVRRPSDYLPKMIEMAGGSYFLAPDGEDESKSSTMSMEMEAFYAAAKDCDYIIYNSTVDGELRTRQELLAKSPLLENFKAVQSGNVYCTTQNLYQSTMELGTLIADIHGMLLGEDQALNYLYRLE